MMKSKEAIEWIFDIWHEWENVYGVDVKEVLEEGKKMDQVISLLKQDEALKAENVELKAYKQMWKEVEKESHLGTWWEDYIRRFKQKYLKEAKQDEAKDNRE